MLDIELAGNHVAVAFSGRARARVNCYSSDQSISPLMLGLSRSVQSTHPASSI